MGVKVLMQVHGTVDGLDCSNAISEENLEGICMLLFSYTGIFLITLFMDNPAISELCLWGSSISHHAEITHILIGKRKYQER